MIKRDREHKSVKPGDGVPGFITRAMQQFQDLYGTKPKVHPVARIPRSIKSTSAAARVAAYLERHSLTEIEFSVKAHINDRTLRRLLHTGSVSSQTWAEVAKAMSTTPEKLLKQTGL